MTVFGLVQLLLLFISCTATTYSSNEDDQNEQVNNNSHNNLRRKRRQLWQHSARIVGGSATTSNNKPYPFFVELSDLGCGGSLIYSDLVLTAAHCVTGSHNEATLQQKQSTVYVGGIQKGQGTARNVVDVRVHPLYDSASGAYDFAILLLDWPVSNIDPVTLVNVDDNNNNNNHDMADNTPLSIIGYGYTKEGGQPSDILLEAQVHYVEQCRQKFPVFRNRLFDSSMFCAGGNGKDTCTGDSGGPILIWNDEQQSYQQVGVTSWGIGCQGTRPGVYAKMTSLTLDWVQQQQCQFSYRPLSNCPCDRESKEQCVKIQMEVVLDSYPKETGYQLNSVVTDDTTATLLQVPAGSLESHYTSPILYSFLVPTGSYELTITDTYHDGICCNYGQGAITITIDNSQTPSSPIEVSGKFQEKLIIPFEVSSPLGGEDTTTDSSSNRDMDDNSSSNAVVLPPPTPAPTPSPTPQPRYSIRVEIQYDEYPEETSFVFQDTTTSATGTGSGNDNDMVPIYSSEAGSVLSPMELVTVTLDDLEAGTYELMVNDMFHDGICCQWGQGYVKIVYYESENGDMEKELFYHRGDFGASVKAEIVLPPASLAS